MLNLFIVGFGGFLGTLCRYLLGLLPINSNYPVMTNIINFVGSIIIGFLSIWLFKNKINDNWELFLKIGFCGGFTTFSSFSLESYNLLKTGNFLGIIYIFLSVILGIIGVFIGIRLGYISK